MRTLLQVIVICMCISTQAQTCVSGVAMDAETEESIPGCNIMIKGTAKGTITDVEGKFKLCDVGDIDTMVISSIGYKIQEIPVNGGYYFEIRLEQEVCNFCFDCFPSYNKKTGIGLSSGIKDLPYGFNIFYENSFFLKFGIKSEINFLTNNDDNRLANGKILFKRIFKIVDHDFGIGAEYHFSDFANSSVVNLFSVFCSYNLNKLRIDAGLSDFYGNHAGIYGGTSYEMSKISSSFSSSMSYGGLDRLVWKNSLKTIIRKNFYSVLSADDFQQTWVFSLTLGYRFKWAPDICI